MRPRRLLLPALLLALVAVPTPARAASFGVVMPGDLQPANPLMAEVDQLAAQGARTAKIFITWDVVQPTAVGFDDGKIAQYVTTIRRLRDRGIATTVVFFGAEAWTHPDPATRDRMPPDSVPGFALAMGRLATAFRGLGVSYMVWNEADEAVFWKGGPDPDRYVDLLKQSAAAIRAADPSGRVVFTPLTAGNWRFLQAAYDRGAKGHFDAIGVDADTACNLVSPYEYYRDQQDPARIGQVTFLGYREVRQTMLANGDDKPILLELGWSTSRALCDQGLQAGQKPGGVTEAQQAQYLREAAHCLKEDAYVETAYWFEVQDRGQSDTPDHRFGLLRTDGSRRPAYDAFVQATRGVDPLAGPCGDFEPPAVEVLSPRPGERYSDRLDLRARATDPAKVGRITFQFDGTNQIRNFTGAEVGNGVEVKLTPWFGSDDLPLGPHTVHVTAIDLYGNRRTVDVPVQRVTEDQLARNLVARFKVGRRVSCARTRVCSFRVSLGKAPGGSSLTGKVRAEWVWWSPALPKKKGVRKAAIPGRWKTLHKMTKPVNKVAVLRQQLRKPGRWKLVLTHDAKPPYRTTSAKPIAFTAR
ncbi:hypothetical protein GKE82_12400 [Conexibacter sp. W3-3-2]|uniref:Ig-like domain-containing protein n=1 Tax=Conexibacter sp. W3-3-2 TaxID=2675227 RepID=UPI0012B971BB|nr:Ig-like domain-containing protein [Conexibacter sp. W3-3-2]MTD45069.1 hypothetical protein [Conexibacter sp. W3-3-2]